MKPLRLKSLIGGAAAGTLLAAGVAVAQSAESPAEASAAAPKAPMHRKLDRGPIDLAQANERAKRAFEQVDTNTDGQITEDELLAADDLRGMFGDATYRPDGNRGQWIHVLVERLLQHYPVDHEVTLYEAAVFINCTPRIERIPLAHLADATFTPATTLYVPPVGIGVLDEETCARLGIDLAAMAR